MSRFVLAQETTNAITMAPTGPGTNEAQISLISYVAQKSLMLPKVCAKLLDSSGKPMIWGQSPG